MFFNIYFRGSIFKRRASFEEVKTLQIRERDYEKIKIVDISTGKEYTYEKFLNVKNKSRKHTVDTSSPVSEERSVSENTGRELSESIGDRTEWTSIRNFKRD